MFLHHVATISLVTFSYVNNMARVGTLVMCLHDAADVLIEVRGGWRGQGGGALKLTSTSPQSSAHPSLSICDLIGILPQSLIRLSDVSQAAVFIIIVCFVFLPRLPRWPITQNVRYCATSCLQCLQFSS